MQEMLRQHTGVNLRVYVLWTSRLLGDARTAWTGGDLSDRRVVHLWDTSNALARQLVVRLADAGRYQGPDWDLYLLFDRHAVWTSSPPSPSSSGFTVVDTADRLEHALF